MSRTITGMEVIFLGTGTGIPGNGRRPTSILFREGPETLLVDLGPGTVTTLVNEGIALSSLRAVVLTHFHLDHCADLGALFFAMKYGLPTRMAPLQILGPRGLSQWFHRLQSLYGPQIEVSFPVQIREVSPGTHERLGSLHLQFWKNAHTPESLGLTIRHPSHTLIYTSDTEFSTSWISALPRGADLLITECSLPFRVPGHLTPEDAGRVADHLHVRALMLVHLYPLLSSAEAVQRARKHYAGPIQVPWDGFRLILP